ncbi:MAG: ORC1-type DNA replication protein [Candidatus Woesearchaeota archaeon]
MSQKPLKNFFDNFMKKNAMFLNKKVLQSQYTPDNIEHRDEQIDQIAKILAPSLRLERPSSLFVYGKTGTGKTLSVKYVTNQLLESAKNSNIPIKIVYINCKLKKVADTEYRLIAQVSRNFGKEIPPTGLPTDEVYKIFYSALEKQQTLLLLILDEIDQLVSKAGDEILYNLIRINEELKNSQVGIIGISNDLMFIDNVDPRVKSSLSEEEIIFPPYNALQIKSILEKRSKIAFRDDVIDQGVIEKCAAYAAREHGDARRALELMRVSGEIAERSGHDKISMKHLDMAEEKIERDRLSDIVFTQPKQFQATMYSIIKISSEKKGVLFTGEIYELYKSICQTIGLRPLTQRRISDILCEMDMLGLINAKIISKGRYGRTREITLSIPPQSFNIIIKILEEGLGLK